MIQRVRLTRRSLVSFVVEAAIPLEIA
jgi:hypothetical protein